MSIKPLKDKVLIAESKKQETTSSGIIIEGSGTGDTRTGKVLAVGPDVEVVKEGDEVYVNWSKCQAVTIDGKQRAITEEENIIAVVSE